MPATYDPGDSPLLTGPAAKLRTDALTRDAYARVAERLLGLLPPAFLAAADIQDAKDAVALQITHLLVAGPSAFVASSESRGAISITYRADVSLSPLAVALAGAVLVRNGRANTTSAFSGWATGPSSLRGGAGLGIVGEITEYVIQP